MHITVNMISQTMTDRENIEQEVEIMDMSFDASSLTTPVCRNQVSVQYRVWNISNPCVRLNRMMLNDWKPEGFVSRVLSVL